MSFFCYSGVMFAPEICLHHWISVVQSVQFSFSLCIIYCLNNTDSQITEFLKNLHPGNSFAKASGWSVWGTVEPFQLKHVEWKWMDEGFHLLTAYLQVWLTGPSQATVILLITESTAFNFPYRDSSAAQKFNNRWQCPVSTSVENEGCLWKWEKSAGCPLSTLSRAGRAVSLRRLVANAALA